jgi:hypothetical protein
MKLSDIFSESTLTEVGIIKSFQAGYRSGKNRVLGVKAPKKGKAGRISKTIAQDPTQPSAQSATPSTIPQTNTQPADQATPAQNIAAQQALNQKLSAGNQDTNDYLRSLSAQIKSEPDTNKKIELGRELINFVADRRSQPNWETLSGVAGSIIKKNIPDPNFVKPALEKIKDGGHIGTDELESINYMLESVGLSLIDLGLEAILTESKSSYILRRVVDTSILDLRKLAGL